MPKAKNASSYQQVMEYLENNGAIYDPHAKFGQLVAFGEIKLGREDRVITKEKENGEMENKYLIIGKDISVPSRYKMKPTKIRKCRRYKTKYF